MIWYDKTAIIQWSDMIWHDKTAIIQWSDMIWQNGNLPSKQSTSVETWAPAARSPFDQSLWASVENTTDKSDNYLVLTIKFSYDNYEVKTAMKIWQFWRISDNPRVSLENPFNNPLAGGGRTDVNTTDNCDAHKVPTIMKIWQFW